MKIDTNNPCYIPDGRVILFNFPAGAGGKMLQNCVALSRYCVLSKLAYAVWQMDYQVPIDKEFYQQKLKWILETLPLKSDMEAWCSYELGETLLYGQNFVKFNQEQPILEPEIYRLAKSGLWATITLHNYESNKHYVKYWPNVKHICLVNSKEFAKKSLAVKNVDLSYDKSWEISGRNPQDTAFEFDIDNTIYNTEKFIFQVKDLYQYLGFDDCQEDLISDYHKKYIELHQ